MTTPRVLECPPFEHHRWYAAYEGRLCRRCGVSFAEAKARRMAHTLTEAQVKEGCMAMLDILVARGQLVYLDRPAPRPGSSKEGARDSKGRNVGFHVIGGPDVVGIVKYILSTVRLTCRPIAIEYKATGGKLRPEQQKWREAWENMGGVFLGPIDSEPSQRAAFEAADLPYPEEA